MPEKENQFTAEKEDRNKKMLEVIYPDSIPVPLSAIKIPSDLENLVRKMSEVKRYIDPKHNPLGFVDDNGRDHLLRLQWRLTTLPRERWGEILFQLNSRITRMLWVHDIGELGKDNDMVATRKFESPDLAEDVETAERDTARGILSDEDFRLYEDFENTSAYLKGKSEKFPVTPEAVLAKTLDFADGPLVYFHFFIKWLVKNTYDGKIPPEVVFTYTFAENRKFEDRILKIPHIGKDQKELCAYLLHRQLETVISLWGGVHKDKIPGVMRDQLELMSGYLRSVENM